MSDALLPLKLRLQVRQDGAREPPDHVLPGDTPAQLLHAVAPSGDCKSRIAFADLFAGQGLEPGLAKLAPGAGLEPAYRAVAGYIWLTARPHTNLSIPELLVTLAPQRENQQC